MIFCTVACTNHLPLSMVLAKSAKEHHKNLIFVLCLVEESIPQKASQFPYFDHIILAKDLGIPDFERFIFKYNQYESASAIKAFLLLFLMFYFPDQNQFVYLDSDIKIYSPFNEVKRELKKSSILLTPHLTEPSEKSERIKREIQLFNYGLYNAGFIGISRSEDAFRFLSWWAGRNYSYCYDEKEQGLFFDQRWLDLVPVFFKKAAILDHPGYNVARWNITERKVIQELVDNYTVNGEPLRFIHFSGLKKWFDKELNPIHSNKQAFVYSLRNQYLEEILEMGYQEFIKTHWSYDLFNSGESILKFTKKLYRTYPEFQEHFPHPFIESNASFLKYALKMKKRKKIAPYLYPVRGNTE
jgi:hypothetical protein